tara:strand:+ start:144 stop:836 length:693 start_codon:yes stop_codon:yes gene_type:complete
MFDFLTNALNNTLGLIPDNLNPMNLIPEGVKNLGGLLGDAAQVVDPGKLAPKIRPIVAEMAANQARINNPLGQLTGTQTGTVGDRVQGFISAETGLPVITSGSPALNQGIFAPNLNPDINTGILGDIYPQINQVDPLFNASLQATPEKDTELADADEGDDKKKEKDRANMINDILALEAQRQREMTNSDPMQIQQPVASAGSSAPVLELSPQQMITIANNRRNDTFGILG